MEHEDTSRDELSLTTHAIRRMHARSLSRCVVQDVIEYGRHRFVRGALVFVVGEREVKKLASRGIDLRPCEGVHVICSLDGRVMTVYRNRDLRGLRAARWPRQGRRGRRH